MRTKIVILMLLILAVEPFIFYEIQLREFQNDYVVYTVLRILLFIILFIGVGYIYVLSIVEVFSYFDNKEWYSIEQLLRTLVSIIFLLLSILPIVVVSKVGSLLEDYKQTKINEDGKITKVLIHFKQGEYFTNRGGPRKRRFINYFDLVNKQGDIYQLEFYEQSDIFRPGDSIIVQYLESNPNYFQILRRYPSD